MIWYELKNIGFNLTDVIHNIWYFDERTRDQLVVVKNNLYPIQSFFVCMNQMHVCGSGYLWVKVHDAREYLKQSVKLDD